MSTTINPKYMNLLRQAIQKKELTVKKNDGNTLVLGSKTPVLGDVQLKFEDKNNNNKIDGLNELFVTIQGKKVSAKKIPAAVWQGLLPLFNAAQKTREITSVQIEVPLPGITEFDQLVQANFGVSTEQLTAKAKKNMEQLTKEANSLGKKIKPTAANWFEALKYLEGQKRLSTPKEVMVYYNQTALETLHYMKKKGWVSADIKQPELLEDTTNMGSGARVNPDTGKILVETGDKASDVYFLFNAKSTLIHELAHCVDLQKNAGSENPLREGLAYHLEQKAYQEGDFYTTDAEKMQALKWQMVRNARVIKSVELQQKQTTPKEAIAYFINTLGLSEGQAISEVSGMTNSNYAYPLEKMSYMGGSEGIAALWQKVQAKNPKLTYSKFLDVLYKQGPNDSGKISDVAKKEFGIDMK